MLITNLLLLIAVITCGVIDYKKYIIPNAITVPLIAVGLVMQIYHQNWSNILFALAIGLAVLILAALTGGMGGGDIKLILALFLWLHPTDCLNIIIVSSTIGIVWGIAKKSKAVGFRRIKDEYVQKLIMLRAIGIKGIQNQGAINSKHEIVPFGTCVALGVVFYYMYVYMVWQNLI